MGRGGSLREHRGDQSRRVEDAVDDCAICAKHRGDGPLVGELVAHLDGIRVYHAPPDDDGAAPLGYLFIETDGHTRYVADLTPDEAAEGSSGPSRKAGSITERSGGAGR